MSLKGETGVAAAKQTKGSETNSTGAFKWNENEKDISF